MAEAAVAVTGDSDCCLVAAGPADLGPSLDAAATGAADFLDDAAAARAGNDAAAAALDEVVEQGTFAAAGAAVAALDAGFAGADDVAAFASEAADFGTVAAFIFQKVHDGGFATRSPSNIIQRRTVQSDAASAKIPTTPCRLRRVQGVGIEL